MACQSLNQSVKEFPLRGTLELIHNKELFTLIFTEFQILTTYTDQKAKTKGISQARSFHFKNKITVNSSVII